MDDYKIAQKRVHKRLKKRKEFFINFTLWIVVCSILFVVNAMTFPEHWWAFYPFIGWGLSVAFQGYEVFGRGPLSNDWKERMVRKEMANMGYEDHEYFDLNQPRRQTQKRQAWDDSELV